MEVKIVEQKENKLLNRMEVVAVVDHPNQATPRREEIREKIAAMLGVPVDLVVVRKILSVYGWPKSRVWVHVYKDKETLFRLEPKHILKRNKIIQ